MTALPLRPGWTTRFAPAPTGWLHLGHVANAIWVWGLARAFGGRVLVRIEDHDRVRCRRDFERSLLEDLEWLGFEPHAAPVRQSERGALYLDALERLVARGLVYVCACSRREILARAPGGDAEELRYPGTCRARGLPPSASPMRRVRLTPDEIAFDDLLLGRRLQVPSAQCGDLLAHDRDGNWTYQFAVAVDDLDQRIDLVVRGEDLLDSTGRQVQLGRLLGRPAPARFLHHPLIRKPGGAKLSKSNRDTAVRELRAAGAARERVLGAAAHAVGLLDEPRPLDHGELAAVVAAALARRT